MPRQSNQLSWPSYSIICQEIFGSKPNSVSKCRRRPLVVSCNLRAIVTRWHLDYQSFRQLNAGCVHCPYVHAHRHVNPIDSFFVVFSIQIFYCLPATLLSYITNCGFLYSINAIPRTYTKCAVAQRQNILVDTNVRSHFVIVVVRNNVLILVVVDDEEEITQIQNGSHKPDWPACWNTDKGRIDSHEDLYTQAWLQ